MKNRPASLQWLMLACVMPLFSNAQNEPFTFTELNLKPGGSANYRLAHPFEILYGPDNYLYISEKIGRILRVDTATGARKIILDYRSQVFLHITRNGSGAATGIGQDGMLGIALHPNFNQGSGQDSIYAAYSYSSGKIRISRFKFNGGINPSLSGETILINNIPASNDHSSGRLIIGADNKIYYSCGDGGSNQFGNRCNAIKSQDDPTASQIEAADYSNYAGKILRIDLNGNIPADNPVFNGVRSHVFSKGHRNPQGLVWEKSSSNGLDFPSPVTNGKLFSSEQGPRTDDEINIIEAGGNYGWPYIAGDLDNLNYQYINWSSSPACSSTSYTENTIPAGAVVLDENDAPTALQANFKKPVMNLFTTCGSQAASACDAGGTNWMKFSTIAPSSIDYYHVQGGASIPGWYPSLLVPTLKKGTLYRVKLNASHDAPVTDTIPYFATYNRYRDIAVSPDGLKIYIVTDSIGSTSGPSGAGTSTLTNRGAILVFQYNTALLDLSNDRIKRVQQNKTSIYPNPACEYVKVELDKTIRKPVNYFIYDVRGVLLKKGASNQPTFTIPVNHLHPGVYILKISDAHDLEQISRKIIVN